MGSGFKNFGAEVLTSNDVDGYLMRQAIMSFASAAARDSALSGVLAEGMVAYLQDSNRYTWYDGSNWLPFRGRWGWAVRRAATQSVNSASNTNVSWDTEDIDTDGYITATSATVTIPTGLGGIYILTASALWATSTTGTQSVVEILKGGVVVASAQGAAFSGVFTTAATLAMSAADTLVVRVYQNSGGAINIDEAFFQGWMLTN